MLKEHLDDKTSILTKFNLYSQKSKNDTKLFVFLKNSNNTGQNLNSLYDFGLV